MLRLSPALRPAFILATVIASIALPARLSAEAAPKYFAARTLEDVSARAMLGVPADKGVDALKDIRLSTGDLNADGAKDYVIAARYESSAVIAAYLGNKDPRHNGLDDAAYAGFIAADSDELPVVRVCDILGKGKDELRIESVRATNDGGQVRTVKFAQLNDKALKTVFFAVLDETQREGLYHKRTTHVVRVRDNDGDGVNEIEVATRSVELVGDGKAEREIAESVSTVTASYAFDGTRFELKNTERHDPTAEQRLVVANKLADAGEADRAAVIAHALLAADNTPRVVVEQARKVLDAAPVSGNAARPGAGRRPA